MRKFLKRNGTWLTGCALLCLAYNLYFLFLLPQVKRDYLWYLDVLVGICLAIALAASYGRFYRDEKEKKRLLQADYLIWETWGRDRENMDIFLHDMAIMENRAAKQFDSNCELQDYIARWYHEVKTPLAAALLLTEKLEDEEIKREMQEQLEHIKGRLRAALLGCKLQGSLFDLQVKETQLAECVKISLRNNRFFLLGKGFTIEVATEVAPVYTDRSWVVYVLDQLIDNAIKYCAKAPVLKIWSGQEDNHVCLYVEDNGEGIKDSDIRIIFEKGYTGAGYHNGKYKSTGMGLYMVSMILEKLGHDIRVESVYGQYTRFRIIF